MDKQYLQGFYITAKETQYGVILKVGVKLEQFYNNPNKDGWINFDIKKAKNGKYYAELQHDKEA